MVPQSFSTSTETPFCHICIPISDTLRTFSRNNIDVLHLGLSKFLKGYDRVAVGLQCAVSSVDMYTSPSIGFFLLQVR